MLHELPLVIFTIAAQMSVGTFVVLGLIHLARASVPQQVMDRVTDPALYAIGPLLVFGLLASTFHLGSPLRAANAIRHFDTSWLSREIVFGMAFFVLGALFAVMQWFKLGTHRLRQFVAAATAVVGLVLVWCISQVYSLRTVPAWATVHTPIRFFVTTFILGALAVGIALVAAAYLRQRRGDIDPAEDKLMRDSIRGIALIGILALGVKFIGLPSYLSYLAGEGSTAAEESMRILSETYGGFSLVQSVLIVLGVVLLGILLFRMAGGSRVSSLLPTVTVVAFALVLAGEVIGRMLFYASMVRVGM